MLALPAQFSDAQTPVFTLSVTPSSTPSPTPISTFLLSPFPTTDPQICVTPTPRGYDIAPDGCPLDLTFNQLNNLSDRYVRDCNECVQYYTNKFRDDASLPDVSLPICHPASKHTQIASGYTSTPDFTAIAGTPSVTPTIAPTLPPSSHDYLTLDYYARYKPATTTITGSYTDYFSASTVITGGIKQPYSGWHDDAAAVNHRRVLGGYAGNYSVNTSHVVNMTLLGNTSLNRSIKVNRVEVVQAYYGTCSTFTKWGLRSVLTYADGTTQTYESWDAPLSSAPIVFDTQFPFRLYQMDIPDNGKYVTKLMVYTLNECKNASSIQVNIRFQDVRVQMTVHGDFGAVFPTATPTITSTPTETPVWLPTDFYSSPVPFPTSPPFWDGDEDEWTNCQIPELQNGEPVVEYNPPIGVGDCKRRDGSIGTCLSPLDDPIPQCYTLLPEISFDLPIIGHVELLSGLQLCVKYYSVPSVAFFGIVFSLDFIFIILALYLVRRLMTV